MKTTTTTRLLASLALLSSLLLPASLHAQITVNNQNLVLNPISAGAYTGDHATTTTDYVITDTGTLTIQNLSTIASGNGSVFYSTAGLRFTATLAAGNTAGIIVLDGGGSFSAPTISAAGSQGGAFYLTGGNNTLTLISGSTSLTNTGTIQNFWTAGIAGVLLLSGNNNNITLENFYIYNNGANNTASARGGVFNIQGGSAAQPTITTINNVTFANNSINGNGAAAASAQGGAIFYQATGNFTLSNVTFSDNSANHNSTAAATASGGALYVSTAAMNFTNVTFTGNSANAAPAAGSAATAFGGAIYLTTHAISFNGATFIGNVAKVTSGNAVTAYGGAIYLGSVSSMSNINGIVFASNTVSINSTTGFAQGGAIFMGNTTTAGGNATLSDAIFTNNAAVTLTNASQLAQGGAIYLGTNTPAATITASTMNITSTGNYATGNTPNTPSAAAGGFAYLNTGNLNLNANANLTMTIGSAAATNYDTLVGLAAARININTTALNTGTIILHANSIANAAPVAVNRGALLLANNNASLGGPVNIFATGRAGGIGTLGTSGTVQNNATLQVGYNRVASETLNIGGNLSLLAGSILDYGIYGSAATPSSDFLNITGNLTAGAFTVNVNQLFASGSVALLTAANDLTNLTNPGTFDTCADRTYR